MNSYARLFILMGGLLLIVTANLFSQPIINSFYPKFGNIGSDITIIGENFSTVPDNNIVYFGAVRASVVSALPNEIHVLVPIGASYDFITVTINKLVAYSTSKFIPTYISCGNTYAQFGPQTEYNIAAKTTQIKCFDVDNDGLSEIVAGVNDFGVSIRTNNSLPGSLNFPSLYNYSNGIAFDKFGNGDFDGDGKLDIAIPNRTQRTVTVARNMSSPGSALFTSVFTCSSLNNPTAICANDFDGDGKVDLAVTCAIPNVISTLPGTVSIFRNTSSLNSISFAAEQSYPTLIDPMSPIIHDMNGDKRPDLVFVNYNSFSFSIYFNTSSIGTISFAPRQDFTTGIYFPTCLDVGDFDFDGKPDIVVCAYIPTANTIQLFRNALNSNGFSLDNPVFYDSPSGTRGLSLADINGDTKLDIATSGFVTNRVFTHYNNSINGSINFSIPGVHFIGDAPSSIVISDMDGDGMPDIVTSSSLNKVYIKRNISPLPPQISLTSTASSCNSSNGTITAVGINGAIPYEYSIDGGITFQNSGNFIGLGSGTYQLMIRDANGCIDSSSISLIDIGSPSINTIVTNSTCANSNGSIVVNAAGGLGPYVYSINNNPFQATNVFQNLMSGIYTISVKDNVGCGNSTLVTINEIPGPIVNATTVNATCSSFGSIQLVGSSGTPPYMYSIDGLSFQPNGNFTGITYGNYVASIKDANHCVTSTNVYLPTSCLSVVVNVQNINCGTLTGSIEALGNGGIPPYMFSLDNINYQGSNIFSGLAAGNYEVFIKDNTGTVISSNTVVSIIPRPAISLSSNSVSCQNNDGSINISVSLGTAPFQFSNDGVVFQSDSLFQNLSYGNYTIYVKDLYGCIVSDSVSVDINNTVFVSINSNDSILICEGTNAFVQTSSNADSFTWQPVTGLSNSTILNPVISPNHSTQYKLYAKTGVCVDSTQVYVTVIPAPEPNAGKDTTVCVGKSMTLMGSGGDSYLWTPDIFLSQPTDSNPILSISSDTTLQYFLTVFDSNGCKSKNADTVLISAISLKVSLGNDTAVAFLQPFRLHANDLHSAGIISYEWQPNYGLSGTSGASQIASLDRDIIYTVKATTRDGCIGSDSIKISVYKGPQVYVPNSFTPNNDGLNDRLKLVVVGMNSFSKWSIYDRWGKIVFSTTNINTSWNGMKNGIQLPIGNYVWVAEVIDLKGAKRIYNGNVLLLR